MKNSKKAKSKSTKPAQKTTSNTKKEVKVANKAPVKVKTAKAVVLPKKTAVVAAKEVKMPKQSVKKIVEPIQKQVIGKSAKSAKATISTMTNMSPMVSKGQARVIEPLSWDAEKPKLNLALTMKATRITKEKEDAEVKSYSIKARYTAGDRVIHQDFGKGLVRDLIGDFKIRVAFRDFEKVLVHGINQ